MGNLWPAGSTVFLLCIADALPSALWLCYPFTFQTKPSLCLRSSFGKGFGGIGNPLLRSSGFITENPEKPLGPGFLSEWLISLVQQVKLADEFTVTRLRSESHPQCDRIDSVRTY